MRLLAVGVLLVLVGSVVGWTAARTQASAAERFSYVRLFGSFSVLGTSCPLYLDTRTGNLWLLCADPNNLDKLQWTFEGRMEDIGKPLQTK